MKVVVQRVKHASCKVDGEYTGRIEDGYLLLVGIACEDNQEIVSKMAKKCV